MSQPARSTESDTLRYTRSRFNARLPHNRLYSPSHYWLRETQPGRWQIGLTRFAVRMLGDIVEFGFEAKPGTAVKPGQIVGWIEAFKAVSDVYCVATGAFIGHNAALDDDPSLIDHDAHGKGWLYEVTGTPDGDCVDAQGYAAILDGHIDKMLGDPRYSESNDKP